MKDTVSVFLPSSRDQQYDVLASPLLSPKARVTGWMAKVRARRLHRPVRVVHIWRRVSITFGRYVVKEAARPHLQYESQ